jgi:phospholipid/cholesterol/gamma-HCH transport system substrate-binding protein
LETQKATLENLESSSITLDTILLTERGKLNRIFTNIDSITINLKNNNEKLTTIFSNLEAITDSLAKADLVKTINNANLALNQANTVMQKINNSEGTIGLLLNDKALYNNLENASKDLDILLKDIRLNPKRYIHFSLIDVGRTTIIEEEIDISGNNKNSEEE